jgi:hypothetical protein
VDCSLVNTMLLKDVYPLPRKYTLIDKLSFKNFPVREDLDDVCNQLPMNRKSERLATIAGKNECSS